VFTGSAAALGALSTILPSFRMTHLILNLLFPFPALNQDYVPIVGDEHVMLGNTVLMDCRVPPTVDDVVFVASWLLQEGGFPDIELDSLKNSPQGLFCTLSRPYKCPDDSFVLKAVNSFLGVATFVHACSNLNNNNNIYPMFTVMAYR